MADSWHQDTVLQNVIAYKLIKSQKQRQKKEILATIREAQALADNLIGGFKTLKGTINPKLINYNSIISRF